MKFGSNKVQNKQFMEILIYNVFTWSITYVTDIDTKSISYKMESFKIILILKLNKNSTNCAKTKILFIQFLDWDFFENVLIPIF